jgi:hypothetical protein
VTAAPLLSPGLRQTLKSWWLDVPYGAANTPNWDIAATCTVAGREGLLLVEAKAHVNELHRKNDSCKSSRLENQRSIAAAIAEADAGLALHARGWNLRSDTHYQLCNRFALSWKLAAEGVPVVLVYLGFLNAQEMLPEPILRDDAHWRKTVLDYGAGYVPENAWDKTYRIDAPMTALIRSTELSLNQGGDDPY